jgi:hypothetical protein
MSPVDNDKYCCILPNSVTNPAVGRELGMFISASVNIDVPRAVDPEIGIPDQRSQFGTG